MLLKDIDFTVPDTDELIGSVITGLDGVLTATSADDFAPDMVVTPVTETRELIDKNLRDTVTKLVGELQKAQTYINGQNDTIRSLTDKIVVRGSVDPVDLEQSEVDRLMNGEVI